MKMILSVIFILSTFNILVVVLPLISLTSCQLNEAYSTKALNLFKREESSFNDSVEYFNETQILLDKFQHLFQNPSKKANSDQPDDGHWFDLGFNTNGTVESHQQQQQQTQSMLETRKIDQDGRNKNELQSDDFNRRNYFKILNRVFSRIDLPEVYKSKSMRGGHCGVHIGCVEEIPNFPSLLKKPNVSSSFTIYTRDGSKTGTRIPFEPIIHHQLQDLNTTETLLQDKLKFQQTSHNKPQNNNQSGRRQTAVSWRTAAKIIQTQEYPFDLALLEQSGFNSSQTTRIIVGGYFAKEDEEWIDEVVRQWLILDPTSNIIKVSWADSNRGLYHTAAYNSRIVGRQLTLFLYYLDQVFSTDLDQFHIVGHSLGAHIAGFVGADNEGKIARITGLDPAGPIFVELNASMRLDPSDAKFVDVVHTNGGSITKGALGLSVPSGHIDYYCNGGSLQPGCYFSSVTKSIMDPVERVACSHRRSYRYFIEIIKLTISEKPNLDVISSDDNLAREDLNEGDNTGTRNESIYKQTHLPRAFLFEAKHDDLIRLTQPEIVLLSNALKRESLDLAPLKHHLEFHLLNPNFPRGKRGMYFFKTRPEPPFFASKQYALTLKTEAVVRRKISIMAKLDQTMVAEFELDEIPGVYTFAFAPNDPKLVDLSEETKVPQLSLMWKHRSFNLLLNQQNELHLSAIELSLLDSDEDQQPIIRYSTSQASSASHSLLKSGYASDLTLHRNQWHKFEGKVTK